MADKTEFAAKFVDAQPTEAARILETQATDAVSVFVDRIPDSLSSKALASMLPHGTATSTALQPATAGPHCTFALPAAASGRVTKLSPQR